MADGRLPVPIEGFGGLYNRGESTSTPLDHFTDCNNLRYLDQAFGVRYGIGINQNVGFPVTAIKRIYNYPTQTGNTFLALSVVGGIGSIYHVVNATTVFGPLLTISGMTDFAFQPFAGRAYISPFSSYTTGDLSVEKGLPSEFVYVYAGDGTPARKTGGSPLFGVLTIANGIAGHTDPGFHIFGFVAETKSGFLTAPGALTSFTTDATHSVSFGNVPTGQIITVTQTSSSSLMNLEDDTWTDIPDPVNRIDLADIINEETMVDEQPTTLFTIPTFTKTSIGDPNIVARHLVATKVINNYDGNPLDYEYFFVPGATIPNNTDTFLNNISFFDADLVDSADSLFDNFTSIPAGAVLTTYHNRLVVCATYTDISVGWVSDQGDAESISQVDGLFIVPLDGNPITNAQELRDILYVTKRSRTVAFTDNGDVPSSWPMTVVDNALGTCVHGIATVLDSGAANVDFLIVCTYQGVTLFNGRYITPELSWKIEQFWRNLNRFNFKNIQIINAPIQKEIHIVTPDNNMLVANYSLGMDPQKIRWSPQSFPMPINSVSIYDIDQIILGA